MSKPFLLNKDELSEWAYYYCRDIKDDPEIRKYITNSAIAYLYCRDIKDDPEIRKNITTSLMIRAYNKFVYEKEDKP